MHVNNPLVWDWIYHDYRLDIAYRYSLIGQYKTFLEEIERMFQIRTQRLSPWDSSGIQFLPLSLQSCRSCCQPHSVNRSNERGKDHLEATAHLNGSRLQFSEFVSSRKGFEFSQGALILYFDHDSLSNWRDRIRYVKLSKPPAKPSLWLV
jgi:hypothetical protein